MNNGGSRFSWKEGEWRDSVNEGKLLIYFVESGFFLNGYLDYTSNLRHDSKNKVVLDGNSNLFYF